jgi:hypothetical protein
MPEFNDRREFGADEDFRVLPEKRMVMLAGRPLPAPSGHIWNNSGDVTAHIPLENGHVVHLHADPPARGGRYEVNAGGSFSKDRNPARRFGVHIPDTWGTDNPEEEHEDWFRNYRFPNGEEAYAHSLTAEEAHQTMQHWSQQPTPQERRIKEENREHLSSQWHLPGED